MLKNIFLRVGPMKILDKYKKYREVSRKLFSKIIETTLDPELVMDSARLLGIVVRDQIVFDYETEMDILMDFALNEYKINNKNTIEIYKETKGWENEIEKEILDAFLYSSYTSLFQITAILKEENSLILTDLLNHKDNIKIIDIAFSHTAYEGLLLFFRLVSFKDLNMTSGIAFLFPEGTEEYLIRRYKKLSKNILSDSESMKRYISFFKLYKTDGIRVDYI
ncbi:MAG: hypothetical protein KatS3mg129_1465 [Leptospiraceae bacterium]|nr:MAG: hypothetical protein KatS3mg129_1465 [Leptospiraceae bacterium]